MQRHYLVVRWDVDEQFRAHARRQAPGLDGWLWLVNGEIQAAHRRLTDAMYRGVQALSGPQLAAVLRHLQHPDWPIDRASDVTVHGLLAALPRRTQPHAGHRGVPGPVGPGLAAPGPPPGCTAPRRSRSTPWRCGRSTGCGSPRC